MWKIDKISDIQSLNVRTNQHGLLPIPFPSYSFLGQKLTILLVTSHLLSCPCNVWLMFFNLHWSLFFSQNGQCLTNPTYNIVLFAHTTYNWTWERVKVIQSAQNFLLQNFHMEALYLFKILYHRWNMVVQSKFLKAWNEMKFLYN